MKKLAELAIDSFPRVTGEWLRGRGPQSDIVISSRIRLARNVAGFPFPIKMDNRQRADVVEMLSESFHGGAMRFDLDGSAAIDRSMLVERHLISKELANADGPRSVIFGRSERLSVMVNEEDHLRIQCVSSGFDLRRTWHAISRLDRFLEQQLAFAFDSELGYLTSCPTNVGTGMRVSVMLHLPALTMKQHIGKVRKAAEHMNLALRGLYGEGTQASGDFYQVSNQSTLGRSESELIEVIEKLIPTVLKYEQGMRKAMLENERPQLDDQVARALATLRGAHQINVEEMMSHMSMARLGVATGLISRTDVDIQRLNELFVLCQPAHIQKHEHRSLTPDERDTRRAEIIRLRLTSAPMN